MMPELIFSLLLIAICTGSGINLLLSSSEMVSYDPMGAVSWPLILCVLLIILLTVNVWKLLRKHKAEGGGFTVNYDIKQLPHSKLLIGIAVMLLYGILLEKSAFCFQHRCLLLLI